MEGPFPYPRSQTLSSLMVTSHVPLALWSPVCQSREFQVQTQGGSLNVVHWTLFLGLPRLLFWGLTWGMEWDKKVNVRLGWQFPFWSRLATCSFSSIRQSNMEIVSWRNRLIEYISFKLSIALIFPQVACILELLTFRLCQLIKMFLCHY